MSYSVHDFQPGDTLLASQLNEMDTQIALNESSIASMIPEYSSSSTYAVGDLVMHEAELYECSTAITTAEEWTPAHWEAKSLAEIISEADPGSASIPYGVCTTAGSTVAKTVTVSPAITEITTGLAILVKFENSNTSTNPTLNVNSLGAKSLMRYGTTAPGTSANASWNSGAIVTIIYDGTNWILNDWNNAIYTGMSVSEYQVGTSITNRIISASTLKSAILYHALGDRLAKGSGQYYSIVAGNISTNTSSGYASFAIGQQSTASGDQSWAEGYSTTASGASSHAEGARSVASGQNAHADGYRTIANHKSQHVFGECNVADPSNEASTARGTYVEIVGNGTADDARANARTLDWSGNETLAGGITLGKGTADETSLTAAELATIKSGGGGGGGAGAVRYDEAQSLTSAQKSQARSNIEASGMVESTITAKNSITIPNGTSGQPLASLDLVLGANQNFNGYGEMWSWGESKNLLTTIQDGSGGIGVTWTANPDGSVSMHGTALSSTPFGFRNVTLAPGTYMFSGFSSEYSSSGHFMLVNPGNQVIADDQGSGYQFTISTQMSVGVNFQPYSGASMEGVTLYPMICLASDPNPLVYVPYCNMSLFDGRTSANIEVQGSASTDYHNYAVALGQTVYGATLDVTSGDMTVTHGYVNLNGFSQSMVQQTQGGQYVWEASLGNMADDTAVCSMLHQSSIADAMLATNPCFFVDSGSICVCAKDSTWAKFSARYKFLEFVYPLSSPTTSQVTPTQVTLFGGENQLMVDDCDITASIKQDVADYVDGKIVQTNQDNPDTVPSSKVVYDETSAIRDALSTSTTPVAKTLTYNSGWSENGTILFKMGRLCVLHLGIRNGTTMTDAVTLPSDCRPTKNISFTIYDANKKEVGYAYLTYGTGKISFYNITLASGTNSIIGDVSFYTAS